MSLSRIGFSAISLVILPALASCSEEPAQPADPSIEIARDLAAQLDTFCSRNTLSLEAFDARARELGVGPDDGEVYRLVDIAPDDILEERWVALDALGHRTTVWIAEIRPITVGGGALGWINPRTTKTGIVCTANDPAMTEAQRVAAAERWSAGKWSMSGAVTLDDGSTKIVRKAQVEGSADRYYQDIDSYSYGYARSLQGQEDARGVAFSRRAYTF